MWGLGSTWSLVSSETRQTSPNSSGGSLPSSAFEWCDHLTCPVAFLIQSDDSVSFGGRIEILRGFSQWLRGTIALWAFGEVESWWGKTMWWKKPLPLWRGSRGLLQDTPSHLTGPQLLKEVSPPPRGATGWGGAAF